MPNNKTKKQIYVVIGTRAQLIKMAPVMLELHKRKLDYTFIYTAQHQETINNILDDFRLKKPDINLSHLFKSEAKTISTFGSWFLKSFFYLITKKNKLIGSKEGIILTHGDTVTAVWGALLGKLTRNKVMHIESGLRSFNLIEPFPEELCRLITFRLTDIFACSDEIAINNLKKYPGIKLNTTTNTLFDSLTYATNQKPTKNLPKDKFVVASIHRFENIFNLSRLSKTIKLIEEISSAFHVVFILHPSTKKQLIKTGILKRIKQNSHITLSDRLAYKDFIYLLQHAEYVVSDGGSNQEELSYLGTPTILIRKNTERQEGIGENIVLSSLDHDSIQSFISNYLSYRRPRKKKAESPSSIIVDWIEKNT